MCRFQCCLLPIICACLSSLVIYTPQQQHCSLQFVLLCCWQCHSCALLLPCMRACLSSSAHISISNNALCSLCCSAAGNVAVSYSAVCEYIAGNVVLCPVYMLSSAHLSPTHHSSKVVLCICVCWHGHKVANSKLSLTSVSCAHNSNRGLHTALDSLLLHDIRVAVPVVSVCLGCMEGWQCLP